MGPCLPPSLKLRRPEVQAPAKPWRRRVAGTTIGAFGSVVAKDTPKTFPRRKRPRFVELAALSKRSRAQGMPGDRCARSLACEKREAHEQVTTDHTVFVRHSPREWF